MRREAARQDAAGQAAQKKLDRALRSLGLRPPGVELHGGQTETRVENLKDGFRFDVPPEFQEAFQAYQEGIRSADQ